jgi:hypothetical protein
MATEDAAGTPPDDTPELLIKLRERKERHKQRNIFQRIGVVILGVLVVIAGIIMSGPGVPGPASSRSCSASASSRSSSTGRSAGWSA